MQAPTSAERAAQHTLLIVEPEPPSNEELNSYATVQQRNESTKKANDALTIRVDDAQADHTRMDESETASNAQIITEARASAKDEAEEIRPQKKGLESSDNADDDEVRGLDTQISRARIEAHGSNTAAMTCPIGHALKKSTSPLRDFNCDECSRSQAAGLTLYGCRECNYDLCQG